MFSDSGRNWKQYRQEESILVCYFNNENQISPEPLKLLEMCSKQGSGALKIKLKKSTFNITPLYDSMMNSEDQSITVKSPFFLLCMIFFPQNIDCIDSISNLPFHWKKKKKGYKDMQKEPFLVGFIFVPLIPSLDSDLDLIFEVFFFTY